ncbi:MAG: GntR family transcriptional regulator [Spirochaetaceae bacterium]
MMSRIRQNTDPLYLVAKNAIITNILEDTFKEKLPSEEALCEMLGVSRTTIREALIELQREGLITKLHGTGNLIHKKSLLAKMRIDKFSNFEELLESGGYKVRVERSQVRWVSDPTEYGGPVSEEGDSLFLFIEHIHYADDKPAIVARIFVRESLLKKEPEDLAMYSGTFRELLDTGSREKTANSIISFEPAGADSIEADILNITENTPLIRWQEKFYSVFDNIICYNRVSFHPTLVNMTLLRRWV